MLGFGEYLIERVVSGKKPKTKKPKKPNYNEIMGRVYERATALGVHNGTGAKSNRDKEYLGKIEELKRQQEEDIGKLPDNIRDSALKSADNSVRAYLESLQKNHGVNLNDITEVHHTSKGIDDLLGRQVSRRDNPHDIAVRIGKAGQEGSYIHGASLKKTQGTLGNNPHGQFSSQGKTTGIGAETSDIWKRGLEKAGLSGLTAEQIKERQEEEPLKKVYRDTQQEVIKHHTDSFNAATPEQQREHLKYLMKMNYDKEAPMDYVNGEKGYSIPVDDMEHSKAVNNSSKFAAVSRGTTTHVYDDQGRHLLTVEHRATHGPFVSMQANAKLGSLKVPTGETPEKTPRKTRGHKLADPEASASAASVQPLRVKKLLSGFRTPVSPQERRVPQTGSAVQSIPAPKVSMRTSTDGWPEHMYQAHKDRSIGGHQDSGQ